MPERAVSHSHSRAEGFGHGSRPKDGKPRARARRVLSFPAGEREWTKAEAAKLFAKFGARTEMALGQLRAQLIPESSWKRSTEVLGPVAAQTVARLARVLEFATRTWGKEADAVDWLLGPHAELGGATPFSLLRTESGGRTVENLMAALEFGFSV